jgi:hypothetical protein
MHNVTTFTITSRPYYDEYRQNYKNVLMLNIEPPGPLRRFVRRIQPTLRNRNIDYDYNYDFPKCGLALTSFRYYNASIDYGYNKCADYMTPEEIPDLMSFLLANGYQLDTQITNMLNQSEVKFANGKLVFAVSYHVHL